MRTSKPISTISYNSEPFLLTKLTELLECDIVSFFAFIRHQPEEDESKAHYHLYLELGDSIEIKKGSPLQLSFAELDPQKPDKPLGVQPFRKSHTFADWYFYAIHHQAYLISKGQSRKFFYGDDDLIVSDKDYFADLKAQINFAKYFRQAENIERLKRGASVYELVEQGLINTREVIAYNYLSQEILYRSRPTHSPILDPETGEVISSNKGTLLVPLTDEEEQQVEMVIPTE